MSVSQIEPAPVLYRTESGAMRTWTLRLDKDEPRVVVELEPILDLLERIVDDATFESGSIDVAELLLKAHGRLRPVLYRERAGR